MKFSQKRKLRNENFKRIVPMRNEKEKNRKGRLRGGKKTG